MFNKRVELLAFDDVVGFLEQGHRENVHLDYKQEMISGSKIAKLAGALANTDGGFIVFGVKESDRAPVRPFEGADLKKDPAQAVQNACRHYLTPPVEPQFSKVLTNPLDASKAFLVVAIPQSGKAPHLFKESGGDEEYVYIKSQDHKEPVYPTLARYELIRDKREASRARAEQIMLHAQGELDKAWKRIRPTEQEEMGGRRPLQIPFVRVAVCRAFPETDVLAVPQITIERFDQYTTQVKHECFQWSTEVWQPLKILLPAATAEQLNTFAEGVLTNSTQQDQPIPLAAIMHSEGCFAGKVGVPLCRATPFCQPCFGDKQEVRTYVPAVLLCGFALGLIRCAFRWFQAFGCYASLRVYVTISSDNLSHCILSPDADKPARRDTLGGSQQGAASGFVVDKGDIYGPTRADSSDHWEVPWPCDAEARRIGENLTTRYVSAFNVRNSSVAKAFVDAVAKSVFQP